MIIADIIIQIAQAPAAVIVMNVVMVIAAAVVVEAEEIQAVSG